MVAKFWDALGGKIADRWLALSLPALVFWAAAILAWAVGTGQVDAVRAYIDGLASASLGTQLLVLAGGVLVVTVSAMIVERLTLPVTRLLEGHWPSRADPLRDRLVARRERRIKRDEDRWQELASKIAAKTATPAEGRAYVAIEVDQRRIPADGRRMPTRLGDILRAAETRPLDKYGLDAVKVWPDFWLVLPETARTDLTSARGGMDQAIAGCIWAALATILAVWWPGALLVGPLLAWIIYRSWVCSRAEVFADLVEAAFDVHRRALYGALEWPLPKTPADECALGRAATEYIWRGSEATTPAFTTSES